MVSNPLAGKTVNVPFIGTVSITAALIGGAAFYFFFLRKRGRSSKTVTERFR